MPDVVEKRSKTGKHGSTNHARQCHQPPARNYRGERQNEVETGDKDTKLDAGRKVLNLRSDISLARNEIISMPRSICRKRIANFLILRSDIAFWPGRKDPILRSKCRKRIANYRNKGLKNQESFGDVEGSEKWKRIALPKLPLLWKSTFDGLLAAFRGVRSFCLLPKPIDKSHRSAWATQTAPLGEEWRLLMGS